MNVAGESADEVIKLYLQGMEVVLRICGAGMKETISMLYAISKDNEQNKVGQTNLLNMLKTCNNIQVFSLKRTDLDKFVKEAKKYGIKYCALVDKKDKSEDGIVDFLVRGEDCARIDRLVERFGLNVVNKGEVEPEAIKEVEKENQEELVNEENTDETVEMLLGVNQEVNEIQEKEEDGVSETFFKEENQSENSLKNKEDIEDDKKPSVRKELKICEHESKKGQAPMVTHQKQNKKGKKRNGKNR